MAKAKQLNPLFYAEGLTPALVSSLQALHHGRADEHQQRRALNWILVHACRSFSRCFVPGDPHTTAFQEGRRQAGLIIIAATNLDGRAAAALEDLQNAKE